MTILLVGGALTAVVTLVLWAVFGSQAIVAALVFGGLAVVIQLASHAIVKPKLEGSFGQLMGRWGIGMGLRLAGVVLFVVAVLWRRDWFPPLPAAFGYLGVLIPLLFMETRIVR